MHINVTADDIYQDIKKKILNFELVPGQVLSENAISRQYQVSRTLVREALGRLKSDTLIEVYPSKGTYITLLNFKEIKDIIYVRTAVEQKVYSDAMRLNASSLLEEMELNLARQKAILSEEPSICIFRELDTEFHKLVYSAVNRIYVWNRINDMLYHYRRFCMMDLSMNRPYSTLYEEHRKIYQAFKTRDIELLNVTLYEHLNNNIQLFEKDNNDHFYVFFEDINETTN